MGHGNASVTDSCPRHHVLTASLKGCLPACQSLDALLSALREHPERAPHLLFCPLPRVSGGCFGLVIAVSCRPAWAQRRSSARQAPGGSSCQQLTAAGRSGRAGGGQCTAWAPAGQTWRGRCTAASQAGRGLRTAGTPPGRAGVAGECPIAEGGALPHGVRRPADHSTQRQQVGTCLLRSPVNQALSAVTSSEARQVLN